MNSSSISDSGTLGVGNGGAQAAKKSARSSWRGLTLNDSRRAIPLACQRADHRSRLRAITHSPISPMIPVSSAIGMKLSGRRMPVARVVPAQQRLGAGDLARHQAQLRLEGEHELAALDRLAQRASVSSALVLGGEAGREQAILAAARSLAWYMAISAARISASMLVP